MALNCMTEEEAKTKWCPFSRVGAYGERDDRIATVNRDPRWDMPDEGTCCVGSRCMQWRWFSGSPESNPVGTGYCGLSPVRV